MASNVDPDEMAHHELSHLDLPYLHSYLRRSTGLKELPRIFMLFFLRHEIIVIKLKSPPFQLKLFGFDKDP